MTAVARLLAKIERYCLARNIAQTTFGRRAVNDGKLVTRLRAGRSITLATLRRIEAALTAGGGEAAAAPAGRAPRVVRGAGRHKAAAR